MNDELQNTLAELASGLGTTTNELWTWLQGDGINAYAAAKVAQLWVVFIFLAVVAVACILSAASIYVTWRRRKNEEHWDSDVILWVTLPLICLALDAVFGASALAELAGWLASPQGMVVQMFVDKFGG